jgi:hypothetical protein
VSRGAAMARPARLCATKTMDLDGAATVLRRANSCDVSLKAGVAMAVGRSEKARGMSVSNAVSAASVREQWRAGIICAVVNCHRLPGYLEPLTRTGTA